MEIVVAYRDEKNNLYEIFADEFCIMQGYRFEAYQVEPHFNGVKTEKLGTTWIGQEITADMVLDSAVTAYVNVTLSNALHFETVHDELEVLKRRFFKGSGIMADGKDIPLQFLDFHLGKGSVLSLEMVYTDADDAAFVFYVGDDSDSFVAVNVKNGRTITQESIFNSLMEDCYTSAKSGEGKVLFIKDELKSYYDENLE